MESMKLLVGAAAVYVVAACAGGAERAASRETGQAGAQASTGGASDAAEAGRAPDGETVTGAGMAGLTGLLEPVPVAHAAGASGVAGAVATGGNGQPTGGQATVCDCPPPYEPPEPEVVTVPCDIETGTDVLFAQAEFPGRTALELANVRVLVHLETEISNLWPPGWTQVVITPAVEDGRVLVQCGARPYYPNASATFILP
jgi:hypothetical protein